MLSQQTPPFGFDGEIPPEPAELTSTHIWLRRGGGGAADYLNAENHFPETQQKISGEWLHVGTNADTPVTPPPYFLQQVLFNLVWTSAPQKVAAVHLCYNASKTETNVYFTHYTTHYIPSTVAGRAVLPVSF